MEPPGERTRPDIAKWRYGEHAVNATPAQLGDPAITIACASPDLTHVVISDIGNPS